MTRRLFVKAGAIFGATAVSAGMLTACANWTPRSQAQGNDIERASWQVDEAAELTAGGSEPIDDGFVKIEGGTFLMGSPETEAWRGADEAQHQVTVSSFYLSPFEATQDEYERVMGKNPSANIGTQLPVESLTWNDAVAFCNALSRKQGLDPAYAIDGDSVIWDRSANGYRLPTEAEWEFACRAGTTTPFNTETSISADNDANYYGPYPYEIEDNYFDQGNLETKPGTYRQAPIAPGSFAANAWGLFDMHGNVAEWVWDRYGVYDAATATDPTGPQTGALRVNRGGGWNDFAKSCRSAYRASLPQDGSSSSIGLRLARNAQPGTELVGSASVAAANSSQSDNVLVTFFSWSGNTRGVANEIGRQTGFDVREITLREPYSTNYNTVLEQAQHDQNVQARPALASPIDTDGYDTVLIGYPNWWASIPMPIATLLESANFSGKRIVPFCTHGGGRLGQSVSAIAKLAPQATLGTPLSIHDSGGSSMSDDVRAWLQENGLA